MICLDKVYSTTRLLIRKEGEFTNELTPSLHRRAIGGLRINGYYKITSADKPLVSIVTATFNRKDYLEETIQSVLNQTYDNVEYIIIDGGSTDGTIDIIRSYEDKIDYWLSEPDNNMYEAINKGIVLSRGDIIAVLNSDDKYVSCQTIECVVNHFLRFPDIDGIYGDLIRLYPAHIRHKKVFQVDYKNYLLSKKGTLVPHPTLFIRRVCINKTGFYNTHYNYASDYDFILKCLKYCRLKYINRPLTYFRLHSKSITDSGKIKSEKLSILKDHDIDSYNSVIQFFMYVYLWSKYVLLNLLNVRRNTHTV